MSGVVGPLEPELDELDPPVRKLIFRVIRWNGFEELPDASDRRRGYWCGSMFTCATSALSTRHDCKSERNEKINSTRYFLFLDSLPFHC